MKRNLLAVLAAATLAAPAFAQVATLTGAGATFPFPVYSKWFDEYHKVKPDLQINYQSIGSGGGIRQLTEKTVDFGASDGPMTDEQIQKAGGAVLHLPTVLGADVPAFNVEGVSELKLDGPTLAGIFLGTIAKWNDPALVKLNPGAKLPDAAITVVHRSDGSGTTYCFTDYLSKVSKEWATKVGKGTSVNWPVGLGGKGNEGVMGLVKQNPNSIGYVELIYAMQNGVPYAAVKNKAGKFLKASVEGVTAAAAGVKMPKDYRVSITDASGPKAYPISTFTWLLVYPKNPDAKGEQIKAFLRWMLKDGQRMAPALGYAPLPAVVKAKVAKTVETIQ
ncbi:MAG TPA: phosphate ABC transporter substrate-binding protein PstS [Elusimicrobiota bacterium]|nr:phosphate ABC transporter substrate-binding protein PstS [Elusimicrobiota bacterium]